LKEYVAGFMFYKNCVALVKKAKPEWQQGFLNAVGGKIEYQESPLEAMVREFTEETCVTTANSSWKQFCKLTGKDVLGEDWTVYFFKSFVKLMHHLQGSLIEPVAWYNVRDLKKVVPNVRWLIPFALFGEDLALPSYEQLTPH
jgi:8-oxo-dGTP diphosphatase